MPDFFHMPWENQLKALEAIKCPHCEVIDVPKIVGTSVSRRLSVRVIAECLHCKHQWRTHKLTLPARVP